jgi:hypothetical protein
MFLAATCLIQATIHSLIEKNLLTPSDAAEILGNAEEYLAGINPDLMSSDGREFARVLLQQWGKIFGGSGPKPDR